MSILPTNTFLNRCIRETLSGVRQGLSQFSGDSRAAIIFSLKKDDELYICDPQNLLRGYEPKLQQIYFGTGDYCTALDSRSMPQSYNLIEPQPNLQLDGLISQGGSSSPVHYQMWFTEHHPNICSVLPTECWLEYAVLRLSHDIANDSSLYTGISGNFLREYSMHAVHDCVIDKAGVILGLDQQIRIYPVLEAILGISKTNEEGVRPFGILSFLEPRFLEQINFLARFKDSQQPLLNNYKHVRKLLQATEFSNRTLVSDGKYIIGISGRKFDSFHVTAEFHGKFGYLYTSDELICSFQDGSYSSNTHRAKLFEVEEALLDFHIEPEIRNDLFKIIAALVHNAEDRMFGCTFVIDLAEERTAISGQSLTPPVDLRESDKLELAASLSKVDGALHIRPDLLLYGFACLLDGFRVPNENRARGARYNSALRFTAQHPDTIVVVVSSDRPVSIFQEGMEKTSHYSYSETTRCNLYPLLLKDWLQLAG